MTNFDLESLIPQEIKDKISSDKFNLEISLLPHPFEGKYPKAKVLVNGEMIYNNTVSQLETIKYSREFSEGADIDLYIEYYDKGDYYTKVSPDTGEIVENQGLDIAALIVNNADLIKTGIIYKLGNYHMNLSPNKFKYFTEHGISTEPCGNLFMRDNGYWNIKMQSPALKFLSEIHFFKERTRVENQEITKGKLLDMYETILRIRDIEKKL